MVAHDYNTISPFNKFHQSFRQSGKDSLLDFVSGYTDDLVEQQDSLSCVGLSLALIQELQRTENRYSHCFAHVSCEEVIKDVGAYSIGSPNNLKEHVIVAVRISLAPLRAGDERRAGFVLMDPGYHVARPVVIMIDKAYPHTGWFVQSETGSLKKEYCYEAKSEQFVTWTVRETRKGASHDYSNLIFIQKRFENILTITKKRSLFFAFKSYVIRDRKGVIAGAYSWLRTSSITLFYPKDDHKFQIKFPVSEIGSEKFNEELEIVSSFRRKPDSFAFLSNCVQQLKMIVQQDADFIEQLLELDDWIEEG